MGDINVTVTSPESYTVASNTLRRSFRPLEFSSHPWVRTHLRPSANGGRPRLSFLALHYHMHGRESFNNSQSGTDASASRSAGSRHGRGLLSETSTAAVGCKSFADVKSEWFSTRASVSPGYFSSRPSDTPASPILNDPAYPTSRRRSRSDVGTSTFSPSRPDISRSVSAPEVAVLSLMMTSSPLQNCVTRHRSKRHTSTPTLGLAAFPTAFVDVLTTSESFFGFSGLALDPQRLERTKGQTKATIQFSGLGRGGDDDGEGEIIE